MCVVNICQFLLKLQEQNVKSIHLHQNLLLYQVHWALLLHETLLVHPAHLIIRFAYLYILLLQQLATTRLLIPRRVKRFQLKLGYIQSKSKNALINLQVNIHWQQL